MNVLIAHTTYNPFLRHASLALHEREMLDRLCIGYLDHPDYWLSRLLKAVARRVQPSFVQQLERRHFPDLPIEKIRTHPFWELLRTAVSRYLDAPRLADRLWELQDHRFDRWVAGQVGPDLDAVYTFEHAGLYTLREADRQGVRSFHEQPSQHHAFFRRVYREQVDAHPELADAHADLHDSPLSRKRNRRRDAELDAADVVLCNSSFTKRTLTEGGVSADKIRVTPYGFPPVDPKPQSVPDRVVFLNAGTQNLRKGLHLLYDAWRRLAPASDDAALELIGRMMLPDHLRADLPGDVTTSDSIPHRELMRHYKDVSVFVLPSLADGFGMVVTEAMSRGLPVIATDQTGAADVIDHGENGFVVPAGSTDALVDQMQWCIDNKERLPEIGRQAAETARNWQWSDYRSALARTIRDDLQSSLHAHA